MRRLFTRAIKGHPRLYDLLDSLRPINDPLARFLSNLPDTLTFVQIGASDGLRWDPLRRFVVRNQWSGVFVEPIPQVFSMLTDNYRYLAKIDSHDLRFENVAIVAETGESLEFWSFSDDFLCTLSVDERMFYLRKASFRKQHVLRVILDKKLDPSVLRRLEVRTTSINDLLDNSFQGTTPDLLMIDAEGYDGEIIRSLDLSRHTPRFIIFEAHNINADDITNLLEGNGYNIERLGGDIAAVLRV